MLRGAPMRFHTANLLRLSIAVVVAMGCSLVCGVARAATPAQLDFFEKRIRPMLANECYECHGAKKQKSGLRVDFRDGLLKGGDSGPALIPGDAKKSLLIRSIRHEDPDSEMPKDRPKLSDAVIADFVKWINQGAPDPRDTAPTIVGTNSVSWKATFSARKDWWSFKPVAKQTLPSVKDRKWSAHPVDRFLLAKMEAAGLRPASPADRRTLIRRVTFALTGLPPTAEEVRAFVDDPASDSYTKVVDRLLASPRFGEHWARHWMDLVRFAESHGSEGDPEIPNAWRYRDYLIRAFNTNVPWNQLIREHLAGDLIGNPRMNSSEGINESLIGLAHFRLVEHGFNPVDTLDEQIKTIDSQIDVVSKAFQGLTTSCARCHNHKFDPISERDYYALHGIFASVRPTQLTIDEPERLRIHRAELTQLKSAIKSALADEWESSVRQLTDGLLAQSHSGDLRLPAIPGDEIETAIASLKEQVIAIEALGRVAALQTRGASNATASMLKPIAAWSFDSDAKDSVGGLHGELQGGAVVRNGRLVLDGKGAFLRTAPLERPLTEKTLEAWVYVSNLDQRGGGVLSVESKDGAVFDSIAFAEREPGKWAPGSDAFRRSKSLAGPGEAGALGQPIHIAIVYRNDNSIAMFRNGEPYGSAYTPTGDGATLRTFASKSARVLLGMRHTGGGTPFFAGEIDEARIYDRALTPEEISGSFRVDAGLVSPDAITKAMTPEQRAERERLVAEIAAKRDALAKQFPDFAARDAARRRRHAALEAATKNENHPLHAWGQVRGKTGTELSSDWKAIAVKAEGELATRQKFNSDGFHPALDLTGDDVSRWFLYGVNPPDAVRRPGEFTIEPEGDRVTAGLLPAGVFSHLRSQKHNGVFASPRFHLTNDSISVRVVGGKGARVRLITDNYPIGQGNIFPQANLNSDAPTWVRLDTAYRKGSMAYLEFATAEDVTSRDRSAPGAGGRSFFGVERVVFHDGKAPPKEDLAAKDWLLSCAEPKSPDELSKHLTDRLAEAVAAWRRDSMTEAQRVLLDSFIRSGLLPSTLGELPAVAALVAEYRRLEGEIPLPRRVPGIVEAAGYDAPLLSRGDPKKPLDPVPRGYLQLVATRPYATKASGRLELANDIVDTSNPLTSRVLVNRVWHHLFGRGLVGTVDNFGRLGEKSTHPELLDFLAARFVEKGWSAKDLIRFLVTTRAFQMSSDASAPAREKDPSDELLSHARVRRIEAESIRDSLLAISGRLDPTMFGVGVNALAPAQEQRRRSLYLTVRRNFLSPFLETFDLPKPFSTLGRREATNVPAQSLALLNDPFVIEQAAKWADAMLDAETDPDQRIRRMFESAFARPPSDFELAGSRTYLADLAREHGDGKDKLVWRDFAQSLFNLKEFIYLR